MKQQTHTDGHRHLDDMIHKCRTSQSQCENEADTALNNLTALNEEFTDYCSEYERQVSTGTPLCACLWCQLSLNFIPWAVSVFIQSSRTQVVHSHWDIYIVESLFRSERREVQAFYYYLSCGCAHMYRSKTWWNQVFLIRLSSWSLCFCSYISPF